VRTFTALIVIGIGIGIALTRHFYARFLFSWFHTLEPFRRHEPSILKWIAGLAIVSGIAFIVLGCLMLMNLVFVWTE
jgi:hypothetical protein